MQHFQVILLILYCAYLFAQTYTTRIRIPRLHTPAISWCLWYGTAAYICNLVGPFRAIPFVGFSVVFFAHIFRQLTKSTGIYVLDGVEMLSNGLKLISGAELDSDTYLKWLGITCVFVYVSQRAWLMLMLLIPFFYGVMKKVGKQATVEFVCNFFNFFFTGRKLIFNCLDVNFEINCSLSKVFSKNFQLFLQIFRLFLKFLIN